MIVFTDSDNRRECYILGGWNLTDEVEPLASGQRKRFLRDLAPTDAAQCEINSTRVPQQRT